MLRILEKVTSVDEFRQQFNINNSANSVEKRGSSAFSNVQGIPFANASLQKCEPRSKVIEIPNANRVLYAYYPECIIVKRCGGCCSPERTCVMNTTSTQSVMVYRISYLDGVPSPHQVDYINDEKCRCECKRKPSDCTGQKTLDPNSCRCLCNVKSPQCPNKKKWSTLDCDCICSKIDSCVGANFTWNKNTCQCECAKQSCPTGMKFDAASCACVKG